MSSQFALLLEQMQQPPQLPFTVSAQGRLVQVETS
jgi:hypothetical protein